MEGWKFQTKAKPWCLGHLVFDARKKLGKVIIITRGRERGKTKTEESGATAITEAEKWGPIYLHICRFLGGGTGNSKKVRWGRSF